MAIIFSLCRGLIQVQGFLSVSAKPSISKLIGTVNYAYYLPESGVRVPSSFLLALRINLVLDLQLVIDNLIVLRSIYYSIDLCCMYDNIL